LNFKFTKYNVNIMQISRIMPCSFCGIGTCSVQLEKSNSTYQVISECPRQHNISLGSAAKYTVTTPCTNIPIICDLCPVDHTTKICPAIWKYNIIEHLLSAHPGLDVPQNLTDSISKDEGAALKRYKQSKKRKAGKEMTVRGPGAKRHCIT
jgi:hypothetical protein